jgi:hypothetical protein
VKLIIARKPTGTTAVAYNIQQSKSWNKMVLPAIGFLEAWNLQAAAGKVMSATKDQKKQARLELAGAVLDMGATVATLNVARVKYINQPLIATGKMTEKAAEKALRLPVRWAAGLGVAAAVYSTGLSFNQMMVNIHEGDDAAISHAVMTLGGISVTVSTTIEAWLAFGLVAEGSVKAAAAAAAFSLWLGLGLAFVGYILLTYVFKEDTPTDLWLRYGPFGRKRDEGRSALVVHPGVRGGQRLMARDGSAIHLDRNGVVVLVEASLHSQQRFNRHGNQVIEFDDKTNSAKVIGHLNQPLAKAQHERLTALEVDDTSERFNGHKPGDKPKDAYGHWYEQPEMARKGLLHLMLTPKLKLHVVGNAFNQILMVRLEIPLFFDNKTLLFAELWQIDSHGNLKTRLRDDQLNLYTGQGSGPRTVNLNWPLSIAGPIQVRVRLDLTGDDKLRLPVPPEERGGIDKDEKITSDGQHFWAAEHLDIEPMNNTLNAL